MTTRWPNYLRWGPPALGLMTITVAFFPNDMMRAGLGAALVSVALILGEVRGLHVAADRVRRTLSDPTAGTEQAEADGEGKS